MSLARLPIRSFLPKILPNPSISQCRHASILFALSALSNSRETQHFNKATRLSRVEHSPALKLIKNSEVDPFVSKQEVGAKKDGGLPSAEELRRAALKDVKAAAASDAAKVVASQSRRKKANQARRAMSIGKAYIRDQTRRQAILKRRVRYLSRVLNTSDGGETWRSTLTTLFWMTLGAAFSAVYFGQTLTTVDSGVKGREIAAAADMVAQMSESALADAQVAGAASADGAAATTAISETLPPNAMNEGRPWWRSLFWKQ